MPVKMTGLIEQIFKIQPSRLHESREMAVHPETLKLIHASSAIMLTYGVEVHDGTATLMGKVLTEDAAVPPGKIELR